jgi:hypothetical protein
MFEVCKGHARIRGWNVEVNKTFLHQRIIIRFRTSYHVKTVSDKFYHSSARVVTSTISIETHKKNSDLCGLKRQGQVLYYWFSAMQAKDPESSWLIQMLGIFWLFQGLRNIVQFVTKKNKACAEQ